jgi:dTDP-4-amino-4,6-dideoxygalactose transaminase
MPSWHCGVEVQAAIEAGLEVGFYRVMPDHHIDLEDLERKLADRPGPVLLVHYFGFGHPDLGPVSALCRRAGCVWIEDCAHALFSRQGALELGACAPISIYSFRKSLPVFDGGALRANSALQGFKPLPRGRRSAAPYKRCLKTIGRGLAGDRLTALYRRLRWGPPADPAELPPPDLSAGSESGARMSWLSQRLASAVDPATVIQNRRRNWTELASRLSGWRPVFGELGEGVCPLAFPIRVRDRRGLLRELLARGIEPYVFGAYPHPRMEEALARDSRPLRDEILCLPLHQEMTSAGIERLCAEMSALRKFAL